MVSGDARLQRQVRASFFALLASVRSDTPWAPSPGGLSSDGYNGHVFWDSETWMYPSLLATEPAIARASLRYRFDRLGAARANATKTGGSGARYPWESALRGSEETPAFAKTGQLEIHVNADISLAVHQFWLATGDRHWLATRGWPMLKGIADYYADRATRNADGSYSIRNVIPPDEYAEGVDDSVYTNMSAARALRFARAAARELGRPAHASWTRVARGLRILFDAQAGVHPEYAGYPGDAVKQADVTLLSYPWEHRQSRETTRADLDYYVPRTDPGGPSMTDAIHSIVTSALGTPGCAAFSFTRRSVDPFLRPPYDQFAESRSGGAFTFTTGTGGFLQEFLYGYTGFRWRADRVHLDPSLPPQLTGVTASALHWRGRVLEVAVGPRQTLVRLVSGRPVRVESPAGSGLLRSTMTLPTRRPDLSPTTNLARCRPATADPGHRRARRGRRRRDRHHAVDRRDSSRQGDRRPGSDPAGRCGHAQPQRADDVPGTARWRQGCHAPHRQRRRPRAGVRRRPHLAHAGHRRWQAAARHGSSATEVPFASRGWSPWAPPTTSR